MAAGRAEILARLLDARDRAALVAGVPSRVPVAHTSGHTEKIGYDGGVLGGGGACGGLPIAPVDAGA